MKEKILNYLKLHDGVHYRLIRNALKISNGTLSYHLYFLEKEGYIRSEKVGRYRVFYIEKFERPYLTEIQIKILDALKRKSEVSIKELSEDLGLSRQLLSYHLKTLEKLGLVEKRRVGKVVYIRIVK